MRDLFLQTFLETWEVIGGGTLFVVEKAALCGLQVSTVW